MTLNGPDPVFKDKASIKESNVSEVYFIHPLEIIYTFANGLPPNIFDRAGAHAVHSLDLVGANDDILQSASILDPEDSILVTTLTLRALNPATICLHTAVEGHVSTDDLGLLQGHASLGRRNRKSEALL